MDIEQNGGFIVGAVTQMVRQGLRIKNLISRFKIIGNSVQDIVKASYKKNGLYDIVLVISALNNSEPNFQKKLSKIIKENNLSFFKDIDLKFIHTAADLKNELNNLKKIVNSITKNIGGKAVIDDISKSVLEIRMMSLEESNQAIEQLTKDVKTKKSWWTKRKDKSKDKSKSKTSINDKYKEAYEHIMENFDEGSKQHKIARTTKHAIKIEGETARLDNALKQFNLASQQFQMEFMYHGLYNNKKNVKNDLLDHTINITNSINNCKSSDLKGISFCIFNDIKKLKEQISYKPNNMHEEIMTLIKFMPEIVGDKYLEPVKYTDYNLLNSMLGGAQQNTYQKKYQKYLKKYNDLQNLNL